MRILLQSLYDDGSPNPFYRLIDDFFEKQTLLACQLQAINLMNTKASIDLVNGIYDENGILTQTENMASFETKEDLDVLKNRMILFSLALGVEYFETLLKDFINEILRIHFDGNEAYKKFASTHRTNKERLDFLKDYSEAVRSIYLARFTQEYHNIFLMTEKVRHIIVHSNQIIKKRDESITTLQYFTDYFDQNKTDKGILLQLNAANAEKLIEKISSLGLVLFKGLCEHHKISISIS